VIVSAIAVAVTVVLIYALQARRLPDLQPWLTQAPTLEVTAATLGEDATLEQYLEREKALFEQTRTMLLASISPEQQVPGNRYWSGSPNYQWSFATDWNRTFEMVPQQIKGGALLLHGLTDAPYSMRTMARTLFDRGYYVLALRIPGHGTVPAALQRATWHDWMAATRLGARAVRAKIGTDAPFVMVGYSNGGALVVEHQLAAIDDPALPKASQVVLMSPMIGISPAAALARVLDSVSFIPYFEKSAWTTVQPEFNPFKFNSFPLNGAVQTHALTDRIAHDIARLEENGHIARMPPILAFASLLDTTVSTTALVRTLFDHLPSNGSELVLFDLNRLAAFSILFRPSDLAYLQTLASREPRVFRQTVITNEDTQSRTAVEMSIAPGSREIIERPTGLRYPPGVFSLSHIAVPFPIEDPLYGLTPDESESFGIRLGTLALRGERFALEVPLDQLARIGSNPFYPYLERRVTAWLDSKSDRPAPDQAAPPGA
jgi:alpha-beta hydrolase superfamily lysophospholipase